MKIGVISDVHGNYEALKAVLAELDRLKITQVYSLGDVAGYYSQINECCDELMQRNIPNIMGNHDWYLASRGFCPRGISANDCIEYQRKVITKKNLEWLRTSAIQRFVGNIQMLHGGWSDPIDEYVKDPSAAYFERIDGEIFMSGHTHVQTLRKFGEKTYCNPGSVGQPRDNDPRAAFAVVENNCISLHRVEYDKNKVFELMEEAGFNEYYYGCLMQGSPTLCKLP